MGNMNQLDAPLANLHECHESTQKISPITNNKQQTVILQGVMFMGYHINMSYFATLTY